MIVEFDQTVFNSANFKGINFLLQLCTYKNRYEVFADLTSTVSNSTVFKSLSYDDQQLLEQIYNAGIQGQTPATGSQIVVPNYKICINPSTNVELGIEEAIRFLIQPVSIILENSLNDSHLMKTIFKHFDNSGKLLTYLENGWIQFENAGGCDNICNFLEGKIQSFNNLPKNNRSYLRCFVLIDSDRLYPNSPLPSSKSKTEKFLKDEHHQTPVSIPILIPYKILEKRAMENYLPFEAYQEITNTNFDNWKNTFVHLSNSQKDYLNIEVGFSKKNDIGNPKKDRNAVNVETNNLYLNLSQADYDILNTGLAQIGDFKTAFPLFFNSNHVTKATLLLRAGGTEEDNEFLDIINKIYELL